MTNRARVSIKLVQIGKTWTTLPQSLGRRDCLNYEPVQPVLSEQRTLLSVFASTYMYGTLFSKVD